MFVQRCNTASQPVSRIMYFQIGNNTHLDRRKEEIEEKKEEEERRKPSRRTS